MEVARKEVDIVPMLREIVETTQILIREKPIEVVLSLPADCLPVITDEIKLRQVLMNLAGNAAKFTDRGRVEMKVTEGDATVEIAVIDTGIGIKEEDLELLFGSFSQIEDPSTKSREGTGLGLAISSHLAKLLGGSIKVASRYGEGTEFTLSLPR